MRLVILLIFILAVVFGTRTLNFQLIEPREQVKDTAVLMLEVVYSDLEKDLVRGRLQATLETTQSFEGKNVVLCAIAAGKVYQVAQMQVLECPDNSIKSVAVTYNSFEIALYSGQYFLQIGEGRVYRVSIHKGKLAKAIISP